MSQVQIPHGVPPDQRMPRTLTVRAVTDVDVLAIKAGAFASLFAHLPVLRDSFAQLVKQRLQTTEQDVQRSHGHTEPSQ